MQQSLAALQKQFDKAAQFSDVAEQVRSNLAGKGTIRVALPTNEAIDGSYFVSERSGVFRPARTVSAVDGSQIIPSRHDEIRFGLINIAVYTIRPGSGTTPEISTSTILLDDRHDLDALDEDQISYLRDRDERTRLAELAEGLSPADYPAVALTDGPISIFQRQRPLRGSGVAVSKDDLAALQEAHERMRTAGIIYGGYIDRPRSDLVVRMVRASQLSSSESISGSGRMGEPVDADLFASRLAPGARSAIFRLAPLNSEPGDEEVLDVYFFYLNLQRKDCQGVCSLARVEIPDWVARSPECVMTLQDALLQQAQIVHGNPYPYALHRAHEAAIVTVSEREDLKRRLMAEMVRSGLMIDGKSAKQQAKDLSELR